jgi:hypothetical protein
MGLIGDNCRPCREAAEDSHGGGLAGRWWRFWAKVCVICFLLKKYRLLIGRNTQYGHFAVCQLMSARLMTIQV